MPCGPVTLQISLSLLRMCNRKALCTDLRSDTSELPVLPGEGASEEVTTRPPKEPCKTLLCGRSHPQLCLGFAHRDNKSKSQTQLPDSLQLVYPHLPLPSCTPAPKHRRPQAQVLQAWEAAGTGVACTRCHAPIPPWCCGFTSILCSPDGHKTKALTLCLFGALS